MADTLKFTPDHLWLRIEGMHAHLGISEHAQAELGEIIAAELPDVGDEVEKGQSFGELESVKTVNELIAPITGQVVAINTELDDHPNIVNEDPYHEGWLIEVELSDDSELDTLLDADEYDALISGEDEA
jgi:glycine cleavage system H protein